MKLYWKTCAVDMRLSTKATQLYNVSTFIDAIGGIIKLVTVCKCGLVSKSSIN